MIVQWIEPDDPSLDFLGSSSMLPRRAIPLRRLGLESLEERLAPAVSAQEQLFVYLLNRARHDPGAYAREQNLSVNLDYVTPRPPLALSSALSNSAEWKSVEMATHNYFAHRSAVTGKWPNRLARDAGFALPASFSINGLTYPLPDNGNQIESIAAGYASAPAALNALIVDWGINPPGHRIHLLGIDTFNAYAREIGVGHAYNAAAAYRDYWTIHATASSNLGPYATGVVFTDLNGNNRYDLNEGLSGVTIRIGSQITVTTNAAGGWSAPVPAGDYLVTASGGGFSGTATVPIRVGSANLAVDFISGRAGGWVNFSPWGNTAPTLDTTPAPTLPPVVRDTTQPGGATVAALLGSAVSDPDPAPLRGIAVVALTATTNGTWQYSTNAGSTWSDFGAVSAGAARLLREADLVRFVPAPAFVGSASLSYRAWDQTSGTAGGVASLTGGTGGLTAFSAEVESASVTIIAENTAPTLDTTTATHLADIPEDATSAPGSTVADILGSTVTDPDPGTRPGIAILDASGSTDGTWQFSLDAGLTWTDLGTVGPASALLLRDADRLRFLPRPNFTGSASLSYRAWDQSADAAGQRVDLEAPDTRGGSTPYSTAFATASVFVAPINDAPLLQSAASALMLRPVPVGSTSFVGRRVSDILGNAALDLDPGDRVGIAILGTGGNGTFYFRTGASTWWTTTPSPQFAILLRDTDLIEFRPSAGFSGTSSLTFRLWDQSADNVSDPYGDYDDPWYFDLSSAASWGGTSAYSTQVGTATVFVGSAGAAPTASLGTVPASTSDPLLSLDVAFSRDVSGLDLADFRLTRDGLPVPLTGATLTGNGSSYTLGNLESLTSPLGSYSLSLVGAGSGIADSAGTLWTTTLARSWLRTPGTLEAANDSFSLDEDQTLSLDAPGVLFNDSNALGTPFTAVLVRGPEHGSLTLLPDGSFSYRPQDNYHGPDSFTYRATDGSALSNLATVLLTVQPVDDRPTLQAPAGYDYIVNRDRILSGISVSDPDSASVTVSLAVDAGSLTLTQRAGLTFRVGTGSQNALMTFRGSPDQVNAALATLTFRAPRDSAVDIRLTLTLPDSLKGPRTLLLVPRENVVIVQADPALPGKTQLVLQGSRRGETISVRPVPGSTTSFIVTITGLPQRTLAGITGRILVFGLGGNDTLQLSTVRLNTILDGGLGNDRLTGGFGNDRLTGGLGDDIFDGGPGTDRLVEAGNVNFTLRQGTPTTNGRLLGLGTDILLGNRTEQADLTAGDGDNLLDASAFTGRVWLSGGNGNDTLRAGSGPSTLLGGAGDDLLYGGNGRDLLIGGLGSDLLRGRGGDDLLIGGFTLHDNNRAALDALLAEWSLTTLSYATRAAHLAGTLAGGKNGSVRLTLATVFEDGATDDLGGSTGLDWFFAHAASDLVRDRNLGGSERLTTLI